MAAGALQGQVAFITGAGSGLGAAFARRLARDGAQVVVTDIDGEAAERVAADVGGESAVLDVTDAAAFDRAVDDAADRHGRLDIMVNNAGIGPPSDDASRARFATTVANQMRRMEGRYDDLAPVDGFVSVSDEQWDRMIRVHLYGTFHGIRAALRHMTPRRSGAIVSISSIMGLRPGAGIPDYSAAKAGIIALTKSAAAEVAQLGIRVNAVCPGFVDTPLLAPMDADQLAMVRMQIPAGRFARAEEIAELVRFLCGPESSYSHGDVYPASGGWV
ncbi:MAG: SDR family oxidoreductase [Ilumatobacteraceae bacterium]|jgi:NAD(P)-dependent dehydrogenase (short-subunit alcohol dehydrogenase family)|nr:SDR family oxidoreductase [Ilumatobacteraceae bacterium]